ncbi:MAG: EAL domain-containing protein, partial [Lachnospiraceae bacterium]|nr:EAL domain-containing protein [Lachnospiraceae bacterium]
KVEAVNRAMMLSEDVNKKVRVKAGIYYLDDRHAEVGLACDHARLACNSIKNRHDVSYCIYDEMLREKLRRQQYVVDHVEEAVEKEYIKVFYQPVIRVKSGEICGYEALVRWIDPKVGMLSPADFIDTLEQFHLIHLVDTYVIRKVCEDLVKLKADAEPVVPVSVNISRLDFELCDIFGIVEETREKYDIPRSMIELEITESALNDNVGYIKSECDRMRELGYHVWLDDFGSGYSSLNTLAEYAFDVLKLDLIFLRNYDHNPKTGKLMSYIISGAKGMGLEPLCEGVESEEHYDFLKRTGCERAQGYYFGKPMPLHETREYTSGKGLKWETV